MKKKNSTIQKEFYYFTSKYINGKIYLSHRTKTPHQVRVLSFRIPLHSWIVNSFTKFVLLIVLPIKISSFIVGGNCDFVMHNERFQKKIEFTHQVMMVFPQACTTSSNGNLHARGGCGKNQKHQGGMWQLMARMHCPQLLVTNDQGQPPPRWLQTFWVLLIYGDKIKFFCPNLM